MSFTFYNTSGRADWWTDTGRLHQELRRVLSNAASIRQFLPPATVFSGYWGRDTGRVRECDHGERRRIGPTITFNLSVVSWHPLNSKFMAFVALTIAGSDPSGGAGLQADLKTFHQLGVYGEAVVTLLTVQNTKGVMRIQTLTPELVLEQIEAVISDIPPRAAKTGALGNRAIVEAVARAAQSSIFRW